MIYVKKKKMLRSVLEQGERVIEIEKLQVLPFAMLASLSLCIYLPPVFSLILCTARMCSTKRAASQIINGPKIKHNQ